MNKNFFSTSKAFNYTLVGLVVFIWGITFVSTKYLLNSFSPFEILIGRFLIAYVSLWCLKPGFLSLPQKKNELYFMLAGFSGVTVYQFLENSAIFYTLPSNVSIIVSICPMFTAIIAQLVLKEKHLHFFFIAGFIVSILGIVLVSFNGAVVFHLSPKGDLLALGAAVSWGFYSLAVSKINKLGLHPVKQTRRIFFWAIIFMIPLIISGLLKKDPASVGYINSGLEENIRRAKDVFNWLNLLFLGLGASAFAFVVWNFACRNIGTVKATVFLYLIPVVTIIFAFFVLGDKITLMGSAGAVLTIGGLLLSEVKKNKSLENQNTDSAE